MENEIENENNMVNAPTHPLAGMLIPQARWAGNLSVMALIIVLGVFLLINYMLLSFHGDQLSYGKVYLTILIPLIILWIGYRNLFLASRKLKQFEKTGEDTNLEGYSKNIMKYFIYYVVCILCFIGFSTYTLFMSIITY